MPKQGEIILIPVPFTDLSSSKRRPVIVISHDNYHQSSADMIVVAMTSNPSTDLYNFVITSADLIQGKLNHPGTVRVDKIYTLEQSLAIKIFGQVSTQVLVRIQRLLSELIAHQPTTKKNSS